MKELSIIGFLIDKELAKKRVSGTRSFLYHQLTQRNVVSDIIDVELNIFQNKLNLIANFSFRKEEWLLRRMLDIKRRDKRSAVAERKLNRMEDNRPFNASLQIGSMFKVHHLKQLKNIPKFAYHDNNLAAYLSNAVIPSKFKSCIKNAMAYEKDIYDNMDVIFTMTDYLRESFIRNFKINEEKVKSIGFGCNLSDVSDFEKSYDGKTLLFVAKDSFREKGGYVLLDAFKKVKKEIHGARLFIVGQMINIDVEGVKQFGFIDKTTSDGENAIVDLYKKASIFVLPSFVDATGNVFLEAMSCKVPCIGTKASAMPEIILGNGCGFVINPGDSNELAKKLIGLMRDEKLMKYFGENGFNAIKNRYNWSTVCDSFVNTVKKYI